MIITTTHSIEGRKVTQYLGIISGEAIVGAHIFKDIFASIRDIFGGRAGAYEKTLKDAKEIALRELTEQAYALGADAVVGVDLDYEVMGQNSSMLMVSASGTAVKIS